MKLSEEVQGMVADFEKDPANIKHATRYDSRDDVSYVDGRWLHLGAVRAVRQKLIDNLDGPYDGLNQLVKDTARLTIFNTLYGEER